MVINYIIKDDNLNKIYTNQDIKTSKKFKLTLNCKLYNMI